MPPMTFQAASGGIIPEGESDYKGSTSSQTMQVASGRWKIIFYLPLATCHL